MNINCIRSTVVALGLLFLTGCLNPQQPQYEAELPRMVQLSGGSFIMGDQTGSGERDEAPAHNVTLAAFSISKYEITRGQWADYKKVSDSSVAALSAEQRAMPVTGVTWDEARGYADWLSQRTGQQYDLPSESQWEFAARGGVSTLYPGGNEPEGVCSHGNIADQSAANQNSGLVVTDCDDGSADLRAVGGYLANQFGIHDTAGNVWEWTLDCYASSYEGAPTDGSARIPAFCSSRVIRGGSYEQDASSARFSNRSNLPSDTREQQVGFRVARLP